MRIFNDAKIRLKNLHHSQLKPGGLSHEGLVPGWLEGDFNVGFLNALDSAEFLLNLGFQNRGHAAARGGQGHHHVHLLTALLMGSDFAAVDEP